MQQKLRKLISRLFLFSFIVFTILISFQAKIINAAEIYDSVLIKKFTKGYTNKFCNSIGFGLSKESAMNFSFEENKQAFKKRKEIDKVNKELLAEEIAISVVEQCGYPINLSGEKDILEFKNSYLLKEMESSKENN